MGRASQKRSLRRCCASTALAMINGVSIALFMLNSALGAKAELTSSSQALLMFMSIMCRAKVFVRALVLRRACGLAGKIL